MKIYKTGISSKWPKMSRAWLGNKTGRHCHWCKFILCEDGEANCNNTKSKFFEGGRIRSWDGEYCAKECGLFELSDWYKDDKNFDAYFATANKSMKENQEYVLDISFEPDLPPAFCPYERDTDSVMVGLTYIVDKCPGHLIAVYSSNGQKHVDDWVGKNPNWHEDYG